VGSRRASRETGSSDEPDAGVPRERLLRYFVSSTFRDMAAERDELVKHVFPKLRALCAERGVTWSEVDLRWGITDEQNAEGEVLPVCLAEVARCRPFFIGMLGERYGWVPDEIPPRLTDQEPWLEEHRGASVTELEILHGALRDLDAADRSFFYLRDPSFVTSLPEDHRRDYLEESPDLAGKLAALKEQIGNSGLPVREYQNPEALGRLVLDDLTSLIDELFPVATVPDPLDREAADHEAYARSRRGVYIGRRDYFDRLNDHAAGDGPPLVLTGESGAGKSALLANWAAGWRDTHPNEPFLMHFVGGTAQGSDWMAMLRRIMGELARRFDIEEEIPDRPDALRVGFANFLAGAAARGRCVVVLDAVDRLDGSPDAPDLGWLPPSIPPNVRWIVSTQPGHSLDRLIERDWTLLEVEPLELGERRDLIDAYLSRFAKQLGADRIERIAQAPRAANPLFLRAILEELRVIGVHEQLDTQIDHYLAAASPVDLFGKILERFEQDYERGRPGLVADAMSLIWAARRGLAESELLDILGADGEPLPHAVWSPLYLASDQSFMERSGRIGFAHDFMRRAVQERYLATGERQHGAHLRLADYFDETRLSGRAIDELPWQLRRARAWDRLRDLLADPGFLERAWRTDRFDVLAHWSELERQSPHKMVAIYQPLLDDPPVDSAELWAVATLLATAGHPPQAEQIRRRLVDHFRRVEDPLNLQAALNNLGISLDQRGESEAALELFREAEAICRRLGFGYWLAQSLGNQALVLRARGALDEALALHHEQERLSRAEDHATGIAAALSGRAGVLLERGAAAEALLLLEEEERINRDIGDQIGVARSNGNQAIALEALGRYDDSLERLRRQEQVCRRLGDRRELARSLGNRGAILLRIGRLDKARQLHLEEEEIYRQLGDREGLRYALGHQGNVAAAAGDAPAALELYRREEDLCRDLGDPNGLQDCLGNQAVIFKNLGQFDTAMRLLQEQEQICRELGNTAGLQRSLGNQGAVRYDQGRYDEAMALHQQEEALCRELGDLHGLQVSLGNQANILYLRDRYAEALALHDEKERICRELGDPASLALGLANKAVVLVEGFGRARDALVLLEEAEELLAQYGVAALAARIAPLAAAVRAKAGGI
jgi:tetratricopeptide (TPR) repeat protein